MIVTLSPRTRVDTLVGGTADLAAVRAVAAKNETVALAAAAEASNQQAAAENVSAASHATDAAAASAAALAQKNLILNAEFDFSASGTLTITYNANGTINTIGDGTTTKTCGYNAAGQLTTLT